MAATSSTEVRDCVSTMPIIIQPQARSATLGRIAPRYRPHSMAAMPHARKVPVWFGWFRLETARIGEPSMTQVAIGSSPTKSSH